jgi:parallel beta-helix repeat protein
VEVSGNKIRRNFEAGIGADSIAGTVTIHNNTIEDNTENGIDVDSNVSGLFLMDNVVRRNGDSGVLLEGSTGVTVQDNSIDDNRLHGVAAVICSDDCDATPGTATTSVTIQGNDLFDNGGDGIFLDDSTTAITLIGNDAEDNVHHDCHDNTGPPSVNNWALSNQGDTQSQPGLCNGAQTVERVR